MKPQRQLYAAPYPTTEPTSDTKPLQGSLQRWFLPRRETRLMSEEARSGGLWMPYPLLGIIMTLAIILVGGLVGLYSQLSAMNTTMIMRDADYQQRTKKLEEKIELQSMYITDVREKVIRLEAKRGGG